MRGANSSPVTTVARARPRERRGRPGAARATTRPRSAARGRCRPRRPRSPRRRAAGGSGRPGRRYSSSAANTNRVPSAAWNARCQPSMSRTSAAAPRGGDRPEIGQPLAVAREADRHDRGRGHRGMQARQLVHGALEVRAVVPFRAQHDLGVHEIPALASRSITGSSSRRDPRLAEEGVAQIGIGGVHRDVERREALGLDSCQLRLVEIGQRDVVAVQERQPEVVVLHVEALAHALRELVDEAEDALVGAGGDLGRPRRRELEAERRVRASGHPHRPLSPAPGRGRGRASPLPRGSGSRSRRGAARR